jgi:hypothetical protein
MPLAIIQRAWVLAERLYIHCHGPDNFLALLKAHGIEYANEAYATFGVVKSRYTFMSEEDYTFAQFMTSVPAFRYLPVLERIVFDETVVKTQGDGWNYYGEPVRGWRPDLLELIRLAGIEVQAAARRLRYEEQAVDRSAAEFDLEPFGDPFLDHIRGEANKAHAAELYLSVMFASRKLIEVITVRLLEVICPKIVNKVYSEDNHDLWYDKRRNSYKDLDVLLTVLSDRAALFHEDRDMVTEFVGLARPLKNETNACVHRDYRVPDKQYLTSWRIPQTLRIGRRLFRKYCNP